MPCRTALRWGASLVGRVRPGNRDLGKGEFEGDRVVALPESRDEPQRFSIRSFCSAKAPGVDGSLALSNRELRAFHHLRAIPRSTTLAIEQVRRLFTEAGR